MPPLLRYPKYQPVLGPVQVVPPREVPDGTLLRGLHLDTACAPALTWQLTRSRDNQDQPIEVSTLSGEPHRADPADTGWLREDGRRAVPAVAGRQFQGWAPQ